MTLAAHRTPKPTTPPPARPTRPAAPLRPDATLPEDRDVVNIRKYADEFDAIPLPDQAAAKAQALVCDETNMNYIRSGLPCPVHFEFELFFERMARNQWQAARPAAGTPRQFLIGNGHRPGIGVADPSKGMYRGEAATDWKQIRDLKRVNAYVFRGDKRPPSVIRASQGFHPPSSRTDDGYVPLIAKRFVQYMKDKCYQNVDVDEVIRYIKGQGPAGKVFVHYELWRAVLESEKFHIGRMVADEFLRGYISTSRDVRVARKFAMDASADGYKAPTYSVYAVHSAGGFLLPPKGQHVHGSSGESEVAHPGSIPWREVQAFRTGIRLDFNDERTYFKSDVIFVRKGFEQADARGYAQVVASLGALGMMC